ncbi:MAG TPA: flagellar assembly peptidoglycan hydrolase FlgJ, partial [Nevskiaceae bacterium]|nr:flagellar assembly peptidoglycan hydrolase FlgJ [Nevskiaceae bacterium]
PLAALPLPRALPTAPAANDNRSSSVEARRFVQQMRPHAERAAARLGVPAELLLAQAALETGWGSRLPRHADGRESHNYFGIKADRRWQGEAVRTRTREVVDGQSRSETAAFRAYASVGQGFEDYAHFLQSQPRYAEALKVAHDPRRFAEGLQKAGYATDPDYAEKILRVMADPALHEGRRAL